jgi:hypothetical protein
MLRFLCCIFLTISYVDANGQDKICDVYRDSSIEKFYLKYVENNTKKQFIDSLEFFFADENPNSIKKLSKWANNRNYHSKITKTIYKGHKIYSIRICKFISDYSITFFFNEIKLLSFEKEKYGISECGGMGVVYNLNKR